MRTYEKDYRYLLQSLIPHARLTPNRRKSVADALRSGSEARIRLEALHALEDLAGSGYLVRTGISVEDRRVVVTYTKPGSLYRFRIHLPKDEWQRSGIDREIPEKDSREPASPASEERLPMTFDVFPDVIRSFSINDTDGSFLQKLDQVAQVLQNWLQFHSLELLILEERFSGVPSVGDMVRTITEEEIDADTQYHRIRSSAGSRTIISAYPNDDGSSYQEVLAAVFAYDEFWGIMKARVSGRTFEERQKDAVLTALSIIEQVIANNVRLENLISIDKLTRMFNRRFYDIQLPIEMERAKRRGEKMSMILLDIDDFRLINNQLGYKKGDEALVAVADLILRNMRKIDLPFRYGGEEFIIILPGTAQIEAVHTAERLRNVISDYSDFYDNVGNRRQITVSIGLAVFPDNAQSERDLFNQANMAVRLAKSKGKNRVEIYRE